MGGVGILSSLLVKFVVYGFNGCLFNLFIHQEQKLFARFFVGCAGVCVCPILAHAACLFCC